MNKIEKAREPKQRNREKETTTRKDKRKGETRERTKKIARGDMKKERKEPSDSIKRKKGRASHGQKKEEITPEREESRQYSNYKLNNLKLKELLIGHS